MTGIVCSMVGATFATGRVANTITAYGNAQVDTAQSKFGGASVLLDGYSDYLTFGANNSQLRFGTGDFTVEFWYRPTSRTQNYPSLLSNNNAFGTNSWQFTDRHNYSSTKFQWWWQNQAAGDPVWQSTTTVSNGTWYHIAISRSGTSIKVFVNGTQEGSTITSSASLDSLSDTAAYYLGDQPYAGGVTSCNGHVDELRISKIARYTSNFTAPSAAFTNDENTVFLCHFDGTDASTTFTDDIG